MWLEIVLPPETQVESISCAQNGSLCALTCQNDVLIRTEIDSLNPMGHSWTIIKPFENTKFKQITCNINYIYAIDMKGSVYLYLNDTMQWVKVLKDLSYISVSMSNKVS